MARKKRKRERRRLVAVGVIVVGLGLVGYATVARGMYYRSLIMPVEVSGVYAAQAQIMGEEPVRVQWDETHDLLVESTEDSEWVSATGATYFSQSSRLGRMGNVILYGHNYLNVLGKLSQLRVGDRVSLEGSQGGSFWYEVVFSGQVELDDTSWLSDTSEAVVTLYTCSGFMDSKRWVVRGKLVV
jgi:LPXTG-site transpeptidase (sortase) family protein